MSSIFIRWRWHLFQRLWALLGSFSPFDSKNHLKLANFSNIFHSRAASVWKTSSTFSYKGVVRKGSCQVHFPVANYCACQWKENAQNKNYIWHICVSERASGSFTCFSNHNTATSSSRALFSNRQRDERERE